MKRYISKLVLFLITCSLCIQLKAENKTESKYEERLDRYQNVWMKLMPSHEKIQFAGGMGLLSFGVGWDYGKKEQWETDIFFGFIPKYSTEDVKFTFTLKQNYIPWNLDMKNKFSFSPLTCGLYFNTVLNGDFWVREPERYPKGYYGFSSKLRTHIYLGQRVNYTISTDKRRRAKSLSVFYELSTCDIYLISAVGNSYLQPHDYLSLSFGLKVHLF